MSYSIQHIAGIINSKSMLSSEASIEYLLTDSRKVIFPETSLFFALPGPRRDGHSYIGELYKKGVRQFIVSQKIDNSKYPEATFLQVPDTLMALQQLTAHHRKQFSLPVIGITGSNGKTIVKEWLNQLLEDVGLGNRPANLVVRRLYPEDDSDSEHSGSDQKSLSPLAVKGTEGMVVSYAKCCHPIPGDHIVGLLSKGRGLVMHQEGCKNIESYRLSDRMVDVKWSDSLQGEFTCPVYMNVHNERGVLARLATTISDEAANIEHVEVQDKDGKTTTIAFMISVQGRVHLARIMRRLRGIKSVMKIWRVQ